MKNYDHLIVWEFPWTLQMLEFGGNRATHQCARKLNGHGSVWQNRKTQQISTSEIHPFSHIKLTHTASQIFRRAARCRVSPAPIYWNSSSTELTRCQIEFRRQASSYRRFTFEWWGGSNHGVPRVWPATWTAAICLWMCVCVYKKSLF